MAAIPSPEARKQIEAATAAVARAEVVLDQTLALIEVNERAAKQMIGEALKSAFDALRTARATLTALLSDSEKS